MHPRVADSPILETRSHRSMFLQAIAAVGGGSPVPGGMDGGSPSGTQFCGAGTPGTRSGRAGAPKSPLQLSDGDCDALVALAAASWQQHVATCDLTVSEIFHRKCMLHQQAESSPAPSIVQDVSVA